MCEIRMYRSGDEKSCQQLNETVMRWQGNQGPFFKEDLSDIQKYFLYAGGCFFVVEKDGKIIGMIGSKKIGSGLGFMKRFRVHPDFHGQGIGRKLLEQVLKWMKENNMPRSFICTGKKETVAHHLYESLGAIRKGEVKNRKDFFYELILKAK